MLQFCLLLCTSIPSFAKTEEADFTGLASAAETTVPLTEKPALDFTPLSLASEDQAEFEGDKVDYNPDTELFVIEGSAILYLKQQGIKLSADRIEYFPKDSKLKAYGHVLVTGNNQATFSNYLELKIDENKAFFESVKSQMASASVEAENATLKTTKKTRSGDYNNGDFATAIPIRIGTAPQGISSFRFQESLTEDPQKIKESGQSFTLQARKVVYYPDRIQNNLHVHGGKLKFKKFPLTIPFPYYPFTAGDSTQQMFGLVLGNTPRTGAGDFNIGPKLSFVLGDPSKDRALTVAPFGQLGSAGGFGGMLKYSDPRNKALIAYGSAKNRGLAEVTSRLTRYNNFMYGWNSYMGGGITKQFIQINDRRNFKVPLIGKVLQGESVSLVGDISFIQDSPLLRSRENNIFSNLQSNSLGNAVRDRSGFRFQESLAFSTKPIIEVGTEKYNAGISIGSYSTIRAYTTGNINAFTAIGPRLQAHLHRYADFLVGYDQLLPVGKSPFGFDQVIQGSRSAYANGDLNITRWLTIGGYTQYSFTLQRRIAQQVRLVVGPEDFKLQLGYDPVLRRFTVGFTAFFGDKVKFKKFSYRDTVRAKKRRF